MNYLKFLLSIVFSTLLLYPDCKGQEIHKTKNIVIILIDGYRWQELFKGAEFDLLSDKKYNPDDSLRRMKKYWSEDIKDRRAKLMPFTWNDIGAKGQLYGNRDLGNDVNVQNPYWFSYPGRAEMLSGFVDTAINSNEYPDNPNPNVLEFINKQKQYRGKVVTFACWDATGRCLNADKSDMLVNVPWQDIKGNDLSAAEKMANEIQHYTPEIFGDDERLDVNVYALAKSYIMAQHPKVIYIDFGDTDDYAHAGKYEGYLDDIHNLDAMISTLWNMMQADGFYKDSTTLFVMPDHGRGTGIQWTDHGAESPHSNETWLMVMGPDTKPLGEMSTKEQVYQSQFAQTIARFLGFDYNPKGHTVGKAMASVMP